MLYLEILGNFMSIFLIFAPSKINYARTLLNLELIPIDRKTAKNSDETVSGKLDILAALKVRRFLNLTI